MIVIYTTVIFHNVLSNDATQPGSLQCHLITIHPGLKDKPREIFWWKEKLAQMNETLFNWEVSWKKYLCGIVAFRVQHPTSCPSHVLMTFLITQKLPLNWKRELKNLISEHLVKLDASFLKFSDLSSDNWQFQLTKDLFKIEVDTS